MSTAPVRIRIDPLFSGLVLTLLVGCAGPTPGSPEISVMREVEPPLVLFARESVWHPHDGREEPNNGISVDGGRTVRVHGDEIEIRDRDGPVIRLDRRDLGLDPVVKAEAIGDDVFVFSPGEVVRLNRGEIRDRLIAPIGVRPGLGRDVTVDERGRVYLIVVDSLRYLLRGTFGEGWERWAVRPEVRRRGDDLAIYNRVEAAGDRVHVFDVEAGEVLSYSLEGELERRSRLPSAIGRDFLNDFVRKMRSRTTAGVGIPHALLDEGPEGWLLLPGREGRFEDHRLMGLMIRHDDHAFRRVLLDSLLQARVSVPHRFHDVAFQNDSLAYVAPDGTVYRVALAKAPVRPDRSAFLPEGVPGASTDSMVGCYRPVRVTIWGEEAWPNSTWVPRPLEIWLDDDGLHVGPARGRPQGSPVDRRAWRARFEEAPGDSLDAVTEDFLLGRRGLRLVIGRGVLAARLIESLGSRTPSWVRLEPMECR